DQPGDADYLDAPTVTQTVTVGKRPQKPEFTSPAPVAPMAGDTYVPTATGDQSGPPVEISIDQASDAGACVLEAGVVRFTGPGTCILNATQAGTDDLLLGSAQQILTVAAGVVVI